MKTPDICSPMIMCTVTPAQVFENEGLIADMYAAGMRAVRINTAHLQGVDQLEAMAQKLRKLPGLQILIDTKGPEMRTTSIEDDGAVMLHPGQKLAMMGTMEDVNTNAQAIYVNYPNIHIEVQASDEVLIDDGKIRLVVESVNGPRIELRVACGGELGSKKGVGVAGIDLNLPAVSQQDRMYINYAANSDKIDLIAHSFVRSASDVRKVKEAMGAGAKPIIAKIENQQGIDNLSEIMGESDGILIARGDLTASIGADAIPEAQARIARQTKAADLPLYLATNILPSLICGDVPAQADIDGIEKAASQGVDVMLLTNETASGRHPLLSVQTLSRCLACNFFAGGLNHR